MNNSNNNSRNIQFSILECIGILLVVVGHRGGGLNLLGEWFPIYSFHMPLFVFISGYFYRKESENHVWSFIKNKFFRLVIPYFIINTIYGIIAITLQKCNIITYGITFNLNSLFIVPWQAGTQFGINLAGWFVLSLFLIQVTYVLFAKLFRKLHYLGKSLLIFPLGIMGVYLAYQGYRTEYWLTLQHILYGMPFFYLGILYKNKLEKFDRLNNLAYFSIVFIFAFIICKATDNNANNFIGMWNADYNCFSSNYIMPFISPLPSILFWLRISRILVPSFSNSRIIEFASKNTWTIMMHHQFVFLIINTIFAFVNQKIMPLAGFDFSGYKTNPWYVYAPLGHPNSLLLFIALGIAIPLLIKKLLLSINTNNQTLKYLFNIF